jgi:hypothetical protein
MLWAPESVYRKSGIRCYPCRLLLRDPSNPVLQATNITMQVCLQLKNAQNFEGSGRPKCCIVLQWHAEAPTLSFARIALASVVSMVSFSSCNSASLLLNYFLLKLVKPLCPWGSKGNPNATTNMRRRSPTACDLAAPYRFFSSLRHSSVVAVHGSVAVPTEVLHQSKNPMAIANQISINIQHTM